MFLKIYRTIKYGLQNFYRNGWLTVATISVIAVALFMVNVQLAVFMADNLLLKDFQNRVGISVYFKPEVTDDEAKEISQSFSGDSRISSIEYVSKQKALDDFNARNGDNEILKKSLEELGDNPFEASLIIKSTDADNYQGIADFIENSRYKDKISSVNYHKYKEQIDSLSREMKSSRKIGLVLGITLAVVAVLITFNSIKITMYSHRQEIEIMRLVGASNNYIRLPFFWEGILYGFVAVIFSMPISFFYLKFISNEPASGSMFSLSSSGYIRQYLDGYFVDQLALFILVQLTFAILIGVVSSMIAMRKYLKF